MPSEGSQLLHCYNRGCGQKFDPNENREGNRDSFKQIICLIKGARGLRKVLESTLVLHILQIWITYIGVSYRYKSS